MIRTSACPQCGNPQNPYYDGTDGTVATVPCARCQGTWHIFVEELELAARNAKAEEAHRERLANAPKIVDGFRARRMTGDERRAHIQRLIATGEVADPKMGAEPHQDYSSDPGRSVIEVPVARVAASQTKE